MFSGLTAVLTAMFLLVASIFAIPRLLGWSVYAVASGSMEPAYPVGSLVFVRPADPGTVEPGDCISYQSGMDTVTHRVVEVDRQAEYFLTKGDANPEPDSPVAFGRLVGKAAELCVPWLGYLVVWLKGPGVLAAALLLGAALLLAACAAAGIFRRRPRRRPHRAG